MEGEGRRNQDRMAFSLGRAFRLSIGGLALAFSATAAVHAAAPDPARVRVDSGELQGTLAEGVASFKGIPFAAPPVGELRWRPPQPVPAWTGVRQVAMYGANCMQPQWGPPPASEEPGMSEDCLFLNVWRPTGTAARKLPVMVWIHPGGFVVGSSASPDFGGTQFAKDGVVLVNFNYRLNRFGFFGFPALSAERPDELKGNYGYMDQIAALKWVQRNIAAFGGDPGNVTIFGQSAGGVSVHSLLTLPMARGLFNKAIVESGGSRDTVLTARPLRGDGVDRSYKYSAETLGMYFARAAGVEGTDQAALARLRTLTAEQVLRGAAAPADVNLPNQETTPIREGRLIKETAEEVYKAGRAPRIPVMLGATSGDMAGRRINATTKEQLFARFGEASAKAKAAYDADGAADFAAVLYKAENDFGQAEPARFAADAFAARGAPTYLWRFSYLPSGAPQELQVRGAPHGGEIPFAFGTLIAQPGTTLSNQDLAVSRMTHAYWVNFAKTGNPNGAGLPDWPRHEAGKDRIFDFRADGTAGVGPDSWKPRLDVTQQATESGKRSDF
jgi:para-nitrobenzyl esterase